MTEDELREKIKTAIGYDLVPLSIRNHPEITREFRTVEDRDGLVDRITAALLPDLVEPTWEYGVANFGDLDDVMMKPETLPAKNDLQWAEKVIQREYGDRIVRRRKAGPWEDVPQTGDKVDEPQN